MEIRLVNKKIILNIIILAFAISLGWNSTVWMSKVWAGIVILVCILSYVPIKDYYKKVIAAIVFLFASSILIVYYVKTQKHIDVLGVTYSRINTQSYYFNGSDYDHRDVVIYTLLKNKTVFIPSDDVWYGEYIQMFSSEVEIDNVIVEQINVDDYELYQVGNMCIKVYKDLFDEVTYQKLCSRSDFPQLYVKCEGFYECKKVAVIGDEQQNMYLIPLED